MKQILFTLLLFCTVGLLSCRKSGLDIDIKQYDDQQIQNYISVHGITGLKRDAGDTTGMYYKIIKQGTGSVVDYPDMATIVFTVSSFDGQFISADTIVNHVYNYVGHLSQNNLPQGVELALINFLKNKGGSMRLLVPSHLGYGINGFGTGSISGNNRIAGNQGLDYYIHMIGDKKGVDDQDTYDDLVIKNYLAANNLTSQYTKTPSGLYYRITQSATGPAIGPSSMVTIQYTGFLLNGFATSDEYNAADGTGVVIDITNDGRKGLAEALQHGVPGEKMSIIMPTRLAYGNQSFGDSSVPIFSCLRYEINIISTQ